MELSIYDAQLNELGIVDMFSSLIWVPRFYSVGVFELKVPMTITNIALLQKHRYICRVDVEETGFIKSISEHHGEDGKYMLVSGDMVKGLLYKRTIALPNPLSTFSLNQMMSWLNDESTSFCRYDKFYFDGGDTDYTLQPSSDMQNLGDYTENLLRADSKAFKVELNVSEKKIQCYYVQGTDRSTDQEANPHVIFSSEYGNIYNTVYNYSEEGCYNYVRVTADLTDVTYTETTGASYPLYIEKHNNTTGLSRSMLLLREKPVIKEEQRTIENEDGTITISRVHMLDYDETKKRQEELVKQFFCEYTENFTASVLGNGYRTEWKLGDYVSVVDEVRGVTYKKQIEEVREVFENGIYTVEVVFGANLKTIIDLVKEVGK